MLQGVSEPNLMTACAAMSEAVASFHVVRQHAVRIPIVLARLGLDRRPLAATAGLRFARLMGTGRGRTTSLSADLARTAMFAVWDDADALDGFMRASPIAARWRANGEHYAVRLRLVAGGGRWAGVEPLSAMAPIGEHVGPLAVLTRANVHVRAWPAFLAAGRTVSDAAVHADGLLAIAGVGEAPLGRQATFSLWRDAPAIDAFAYGDTDHVAVMRRTRAGNWYGDELFARFAPETIEGTWDGVDPLATGN